MGVIGSRPRACWPLLWGVTPLSIFFSGPHLGVPLLIGPKVLIGGGSRARVEGRGHILS